MWRTLKEWMNFSYHLRRRLAWLYWLNMKDRICLPRAMSCIQPRLSFLHQARERSLRIRRAWLEQSFSSHFSPYPSLEPCLQILRSPKMKKRVQSPHRLLVVPSWDVVVLRWRALNFSHFPIQSSTQKNSNSVWRSQEHQLPLGSGNLPKLNYLFFRLPVHWLVSRILSWIFLSWLIGSFCHSPSFDQNELIVYLKLNRRC